MRLVKGPWLAAVAAAVVILAGEQLIEQSLRQHHREEVKLEVLTELAPLRARLEGVITSNLLLVHGMAAVIAAHPDIDQHELGRIATGLVDDRRALRNIAGAPDTVISLMYPMQGNEAAIGLDYRRPPTQSEAALRAVLTGETTLAGPLELAQGGIAIAAREPVYIPAPPAAAEPRLWGLLAAVIDLDALYQQSGILDAANTGELRLALRGADGLGAQDRVFFGAPNVFVEDPITLEISIPGDAWQIAAIPRVGWDQVAPRLWMARLLGLITATLGAAMAFLLARSRQALAASEGRLRTLLDTIPDLVWLKDPDGVYLACNPRFEAVFDAKETAILGKRDHDFVDADLADCFREHDRAAIAAGVPRMNEEC
ncbi:CHASE domain-containing protein [Thiorhodococcus minor]|uniref:CHASE domain-containing protein n=1 Tax=Thiorhodococcus minor TaxID=57489 RepID=UPI001FD73279|nr:CHASE domain-containing protein [Thiorhodococcus minor]